MPTYEYRCPEGHDFERFQKISDSPRVRCPTCGRMARRMISGGAGLIFKGSGFYITDYGKDGKGPPKPAESEPKPEAAASSEAKPNPETRSAPPEKPEKPARKPGKKAKP
jgi:putative FmdB family regulatory protein